MLLLYYLLAMWIHPIHISKTSIDYKAETQTIEITSHIFIDDFELAVTQFNNQPVYATTTKEVANADSLIMNYMNTALQLTIDGQTKNLTLIGKERTRDYSAIWLYFEITEVASIENITVSNTILMDLFKDQKNIVKMSTGKSSQPQYLILDRNKKVISVKSDS
ncbi:DUF6702 family protein [Membranihabitans marinus]|uniref:DUF6702 family protein n=1 Tax=Membranihabitans marinus TaxID=1227546 RepID=UPI001F35C653|nr:DUF6702 family protein [Membranihabitans marinus]